MATALGSVGLSAAEVGGTEGNNVFLVVIITAWYWGPKPDHNVAVVIWWLCG